MDHADLEHFRDRQSSSRPSGHSEVTLDGLKMQPVGAADAVAGVVSSTRGLAGPPAAAVPTWRRRFGWLRSIEKDAQRLARIRTMRWQPDRRRTSFDWWDE
jgi:hypothetical protein